MSERKVPTAPEATELQQEIDQQQKLEQKVSSLIEWSNTEAAHLNTLNAATEKMRQAPTMLEFANCLFLAKLAAIPVMICEENTTELQKQIGKIIGHNFQLLSRFVK